jgi:hypothetical protein
MCKQILLLHKDEWRENYKMALVEDNQCHVHSWIL